MQQVSSIITENATNKNHPKIHRSREVISKKVIAFKELVQLEKNKKSAREAANLLEIPLSTMQYWTKQKTDEQIPCELIEFLSTPVGANFLTRIIMAAALLAKCGPSGIRGMEEFLYNSWFDKTVASSVGALQAFWVRCEEAILIFNECEEKRLSLLMKGKKVTVALDEMFRSRQPCLVAIEVVSNYILLEKFTEDRTATTWKKELDERTEQCGIVVEKVVSDLCGAIRSCAKVLKAVHIPELFHVQYEISKAALFTY